MDKNLENRSQNRTQVPTASLPGDRSVLRLPPTRAARASRSRGVFLEAPAEVGSAERANWIEVPVAIIALGVAAFALAVCFRATSLVAGPTVGINPGPAIVAAASVAPPFVEPLKLR
jgi:hypothetical protein